MSRSWLRSERPLWKTAILIATILAVRLIIVAWGTETGFDFLRRQIYDATVGLVTGVDWEVSSRPTEAQADYLLREAERVLQAHPGDARLTMGAAWTLDSGWQLLSARRMAGDFKTIQAELRLQTVEFEKRCGRRAVELAAEATQLEPDQPKWRRMYAMLTLNSLVGRSVDTGPREPNWVEILDDCSRHDPDNALYDYLAAYQYWESALKREITGLKAKLIVTNAVAFEKGEKRLTQAAAKSMSRLDDEAFTVTGEFLVQSRVSLAEHPAIVKSRMWHNYRTFVFVSLWQHLRMLAEQHYDAGEFEAAVQRGNQSRRLIEDFTAASPKGKYDDIVLSLSGSTYYFLLELAEKTPESYTKEERQSFIAAAEATFMAKQTIRQAGKFMPPKLSASDSTPLDRLVEVLLLTVIPRFVIGLSTIGLLSVIAARLNRRGQTLVVSGLESTLAVLTALALTSVVFGLAPAEYLTAKVQFGVVVVLTACIVATLLGLVVRYAARRGFIAYLRRKRMGAILLIVLGIGFLINVTEVDLTHFFSYLWVYDDGFSMPLLNQDPLQIDWMLSAPPSIRPPWVIAVSQWFAYLGYLWTLVLWMFFCGLLYWRKVVRRRTETELSSTTIRGHVLQFSRSFAKPAFAAALVLLIVDLWRLPVPLVDHENRFQDEIAFARDPESFWNSVDEAVRRVESDASLMSEIKTKAAEEAQQANDAAIQRQEMEQAQAEEEKAK